MKGGHKKISWSCVDRPKWGECDQMRSVSKNKRCHEEVYLPQFRNRACPLKSLLPIVYGKKWFKRASLISTKWKVSCEIQPARHNHQPTHQQGTKVAGKAWPKMTKNANFGRFGAKNPKIFGDSKSFGTHTTEKPPRHLVCVLVWLGKGRNGPKMPIFGWPKMTKNPYSFERKQKFQYHLILHLHPDWGRRGLLKGRLCFCPQNAKLNFSSKPWESERLLNGDPEKFYRSTWK